MEIHCGTEQQIKMAKIFRETLGRELLLEHLDGGEDGKLPSPEDLKYKILLKIKNVSEDIDEASSDSGANAVESGSESDTVIAGSPDTKPHTPRRTSSGQSTPSKSSKISPVLAEMAIYTKAYKWHNFQNTESKSYNHVFSFSEIKIKELLKNSHSNHQVEKHNLQYLMRVYPGLTRVTSNNFDPIAFWRKGVQMVALNWQKYGIFLSSPLMFLY